ncbi:MAG: 3-deoxy-D-manno-octulosonic acid transferase [Rhizomicrobium sp.]|jgi:3-deoxy-D-manno-octulosonic-acid transferase
MTSTPLLFAYRCATTALAPIAPAVLGRRALRGKEDRARLGERFGRAGISRPPGQLIWIHGASVGETLASLPLIDLLLKTDDRMVLVTSGTIASARLMEERLPTRAIHQFAPIDSPGAVARFIDHWRPDAGLFVDSEIWPNLLAAAHARGVKLALVNGRMSRRSFAGWRRAKSTAKAILSLYDLCLAQDEETAERLRILGATDVRVSGSLKADAPPLPADEAKLQALTGAIGGRCVFLAASTHSGEEETLLPAHDQLRKQFPSLLTIIVPRHPERGPEIAMLCGTRKTLRRSEGHEPRPDSTIYVADTMGELGLFYRCASFAFMGGSLVAHGGQNPLEPARLSRAVMAGSHTENFASVYDVLFAAQACGRVQTSSEISAFATRLLADPTVARRLGNAALLAAQSLGGALEKTRAAVEAMLADARA